MKPYQSYYKNLIEDLKDPREAAAYLNAAFEEGDRRAFLLALRNVVEARGGMSRFARSSGLHRVSLYKMFSGNGNPEFESLMTVIKVLGIQWKFAPAKKTPRSYKKAA